MSRSRLYILKATLDKVLGDKRCKYPEANDLQQQDLLDALDHISDFIERKLKIDDFRISEVKFLSIRELESYDDLSSWVEIEENELIDMTEEERSNDILRFRGKDFLRKALFWIDSCMINPIIIVQTNECCCIGDGRGRVNIAVGMGWDKVPAIFLRESDYEGL